MRVGRAGEAVGKEDGAVSPLLEDKPASGPVAGVMADLRAPGWKGVRALLDRVDLFMVE